MDAFLKNIKEWNIVGALAGRLRSNDPDIVVGIGDDTAVVKGPAGFYWLLTVDMLVEGVHFDRGEDADKVGYKAMAVSVSDIAAMGGEPKFALVSVGLPGKKLDRRVRDLFKGIQRCARRFGVSIIGGDTNRSDRFVVDVCMTGQVERKHVTLRSGARPGDVICVSGSLGGSRSGHHLNFVPRLQEARFLVKHFDVHAMMDISDGLSMDLSRLCAASRLGAVIVEEKVPMNPGVKTVRAALGDGEDYELLFTMSAKEADRLLARRVSPFRFYPVGRMTRSFRGVRIQGRRGELRKLPALGFRHF